MLFNVYANFNVKAMREQYITTISKSRHNPSVQYIAGDKERRNHRTFGSSLDPSMEWIGGPSIVLPHYQSKRAISNSTLTLTKAEKP